MFKMFTIFTLLYIILKLNKVTLQRVRFDGLYIYYEKARFNPWFKEWNHYIKKICLWRFKDNSEEIY